MDQPDHVARDQIYSFMRMLRLKLKNYVTAIRDMFSSTLAIQQIELGYLYRTKKSK